MKLSKKITKLSLLVLALLGCSLDGEVAYTFEEGSCSVSQEGRAYFKETAEWLAIYHIFNDSSNYSIYRDRLYFPQVFINDIEIRLGKIFDMDTLAERDSVIQIYDLASNFIEGYKKILLTVDPQEPWIKNLLNKQVPTGNPIFDELYLTLEYEVEKISSNLPIIILKSNKEELFNVYEVIRRIEESPYSKGIEIITDNISPSEKIRIQLEISEEQDYYFTFFHGWGDCPRGCLYGRYWSFKVDRDCEVEFLGASGDKIPG